MTTHPDANAPPPPDLAWEHGEPRNLHFDDLYFSAQDGLAETEHVFLRHNDLPKRFAAMAPSARFTIGELGFGTGLNLLAAWRAFEQHAPAGATLNVVSTELAPLPSDAMRKALAAWPDLSAKADALADACTRLTPGFNLRLFDGGRIRLLLLIGDAAEQLPQLEATVDAWFLDGFAPSRNPDLWSPDICAQLARLSAPSATFATYTAAGWVRRNLQEAGFLVEKGRGFGRKRDLSFGRVETPRWASTLPAWAQQPQHPIDTVHVVGGGIIGAASARGFAEAGMPVTVWDDAHSSAPSTLPALLIRPFPERANDLRGRFYHAAFAHAAHALRDTPGWHPNGVALVHHFDKAPPASSTADALSERSHTRIRTAGQWLPDSGWVDPQAWCKANLSHPLIHVNRTTWTADQRHGTALTVLAVGHAGRQLGSLAGLPSSSARGQMSEILFSEDFAPRASIAGAGLIASGNDRAWVGSSFTRDDFDLTPRDADAATYLQKWAPHVPAANNLQAAEHAVGIRVGSADRMPIVGPLADATAGATEGSAPVFANWAHGARGATAANLSAQCLVALALGDPLPVPAQQACALHPRRFAWRAQKKQGANQTAGV